MELFSDSASILVDQGESSLGIEAVARAGVGGRETFCIINTQMKKKNRQKGKETRAGA